MTTSISEGIHEGDFMRCLVAACPHTCNSVSFIVLRHEHPLCIVCHVRPFEHTARGRPEAQFSVKGRDPWALARGVSSRSGHGD